MIYRVFLLLYQRDVLFYFSSPMKSHLSCIQFFYQQDMHVDLMAWKAKIDQQFVEIKSSLSGTQDSKHYIDPTPQSSELWKDLLESSNLDNVQDELIPWFDSTNLINIEQEILVQDPCLMFPFQSKPGDSTSQGSACVREGELLKKEGIDTKR